MAKNNILRSLAIITLTTSVVLTGCGGAEERQSKYLESAKEHFDEGNIDKARIDIKNVLQINPNHAEGRYYLGLIEEANQNFRGAFTNFNAAVEQNPKHYKALNKIAEYFLASKDYEKAKEKVDLILSGDPSNVDAMATLATILFSMNKPEEAQLKAQEVLSIDSGNVKAVSILTAIYAKDNPELALETISEGISNQSKNESLKLLKLRVLGSQGKRDEVVALYKELIAEYPEKHLYTIQLVNFYIKDESLPEEERKDLAESTLRELVDANPDDDQSKLWLVEFLMKNRDSDAAKVELIKYAKSPDASLKILDSLAAIYMNDGDFKSAKALFQNIIDADPTSVKSIEPRNRLVEIALRQGDRATADRLQNEIFELEPENANALMMRAKLKAEDRKVNEAIPDLRVVLKNDPTNTKALYLLARAHEVNNSPDLALDSYQQLLPLEPDNLAALVASAKILVSRNEQDEAVKYLEQAIQVAPSNPDAIQLLADIYSREQRWDDALSVSAKLIEHNLQKVRALGNYIQGRVYLRKNDFDSALKSLKKAIELQPSGIETLTSIAAAYNALEKPDEAMNYVKAHIQKYPDHAHAKELLANLYAQQRQLDAAIEVAELTLKENPDRVSTYTLLGRLYAAGKQYDKMEKLYKDGIKRGSEMLMLHIALAELYQVTDRADLAIEEYELLLKEKPDAVVVKNNLASLLLDKGNDPATIQRAADLSSDLAASDNPAFLDTAGWAQYKLGNYAQAVSLLAAAVDNGGTGAIFHYHLGMAYYKTDLPGQAKEHLSIALEDQKLKFPGREEAEQVLKTL